MATTDNPVDGVPSTGATQVHLDTAALEAEKKAAAGVTTDTAQTLGVSPEQFEKFYKEDRPEGLKYNWQGHAEEQKWVMEHGGKPAPTAGAPADAGQVAPGEELNDDQINDAIEEAGLDFVVLDKQIGEHGKLTDDQTAALVGKGIPLATIEGYVAYLSDTAKAHVQTVEDYFGGEQGFAKVREWVKANLTDEEKAQYETQLANPDSWRPSADQLLGRAGAPAGKRVDPVVPQNVPVTPATPGQVVPYANQAEMVTDMRKPEYKTPEGRAVVMARAKASTWKENPRAHTL